MPFDPTRPHDHSTIEADELRDQYNGLRAEYTGLIAQIPAGPPGPQGIPGEQDQPHAGILIDGVLTLAPGEPATATLTFDGLDATSPSASPKASPAPTARPARPATKARKACKACKACKARPSPTPSSLA